MSVLYFTETRQNTPLLSLQTLCVEIRPPLSMGGQLYWIPQLQILYLSSFLCEHGTESSVDDWMGDYSLMDTGGKQIRIQRNHLDHLSHCSYPPLRLDIRIGTGDNRVLFISCISYVSQLDYYWISWKECEEIVQWEPVLERSLV